MAIVLIQDFAGIKPDFITKVSKELDAEANPPAGLLVHTAVEADGQVRVIDVWESRQAFDTFEEERLRPAIGAVAQRENLQPAPPETQVLEAFDLVRGRA
jgi:hypothetical protein